MEKDLGSCFIVKIVIKTYSGVQTVQETFNAKYSNKKSIVDPKRQFEHIVPKPL